MSYRYDVGEIQKAQLEQALTNSELAKRAAVTRRTVADVYQRGGGTPKTIEKLAKALGLEIKDLVVEVEAAEGGQA